MSLPMKSGLLIMATLLIITMVPVGGKAATEPHISASSAILLDGPTGQVLWMKNGHWQRPMASLTKIMTATLILENCDPADAVVISPKAARTEGSSMYLRTGAEHRIEDLLYGLMLLSGNDAAIALAEHAAASEKAFVALMNQKAQMLGATDTHFANPHGLPATDHYSTAYNLALITRYALANPEFAAIVGSKQAQVFDPGSDSMQSIRSKNRLLWDLEGADGVKTGYTIAAGRCLVASATRAGRQVIAVILDGPQLWEDAAQLLDYAFEAFTCRLIGRKGQPIGAVGIKGGMRPTVDGVLAQDLWVTVPSGSPISVEYRQDKGMRAPVAKWQPLGSLMVNCGNEPVAATRILAGQAVDSRSLAGGVRYLWQQIQRRLASMGWSGN